MNDALVGYTGFVGSNLLRQRRFEALYNSSNIKEIRGRQFETLVFAGAQAKKWWANQNPEEDRAGIDNAISHLKHVSADRTILISTVDVLPQENGLTEEFDDWSQPLHPYGQHRRDLEVVFQDLFANVTIVRLPALFGTGLKKNVLFDLLNDNILDKINPDSEFQYYDLSLLWGDVSRVIENNVQLVHFATRPVRTQQIIATYFPGKSVGSDPSPPAQYDFRTRHDRLFGREDGYIYGADQVIEQIGQFVATYRGPTSPT